MQVHYKKRSGKTRPTKRQINNAWCNMYKRCYSKKYHDKHPTYIGCSIADEWLDDNKNFKRWVEKNYYTLPDGEKVDLDKDILKKNNKVYSPANCIYAPHSINLLYVHMIRDPVYDKKTEKYTIDVLTDDGLVNLGLFDTADAAKEAYIERKQALISQKAEEYKDYIPQKLYNSMKNYRIELSDWDADTPLEGKKKKTA